MATWLTEYTDRCGQKWAGAEIEAENWDEATRIALSLNALEQQFGNEGQSPLRVLGVKVMEAPVKPAPVSLPHCYRIGVMLLGCRQEHEIEITANHPASAIAAAAIACRDHGAEISSVRILGLKHAG